MEKNILERYVALTKDSQPKDLFIKSMDFVIDKNNALDLGSGAFNEVKYLLKKDFKHITAVDIKPVAQDILQMLPADKVSYVTSTFEKFEFPKEQYDFINAQYSLPFNNPETFPEVFANIVGSLKKGGIFTGQLFGNNDEWNRGDGKYNFHTKEQVQDMLSSLEIIELTEEEKDEPKANGVIKHWHIFNIIARK